MKKKINKLKNNQPQYREKKNGQDMGYCNPSLDNDYQNVNNFHSDCLSSNEKVPGERGAIFIKLKPSFHKLVSCAIFNPPLN